MRNTFQKKIIYEALYNMRNHPTAEELYDHVYSVYPEIGKATVYRNLKSMANEGIIRKLEISGDVQRYDLLDNHYHGKCMLCDKIIDLDIPYREELDIELSKKYNILGHDIVFKIICSECKKEKNL